MIWGGIFCQDAKVQMYYRPREHEGQRKLCGDTKILGFWFTFSINGLSILLLGTFFSSLNLWRNNPASQLNQPEKVLVNGLTENLPQPQFFKHCKDWIPFLSVLSVFPTQSTEQRMPETISLAEKSPVLIFLPGDKPKKCRFLIFLVLK